MFLCFCFFADVVAAAVLDLGCSTMVATVGALTPVVVAAVVDVGSASMVAAVGALIPVVAAVDVVDVVVRVDIDDVLDVVAAAVNDVPSYPAIT